MLSDKEKFALMEKIAVEKGVISHFEENYGEVTGRVMIVETEVPESAKKGIEAVNMLHAFECSFDFLDATLNVVVAVRPLRIISNMWAVRQKPDAQLPAEDWQKFFIKQLRDNIAPDGSFGIPMYSFVNNYGDVTIVQQV